MSWGSIAAIYLLIWTVTLFTVLPFGVRTSDEAGEDKVKGQADSAPTRPMLAKKLLWTTLVSAVIMAGVWWIGEAGYLDFMPD
ncbi:DUF1467 family protein [Sphingosinicella soli]|uniref:Putative secreted protein n=1 Tax=Sphingosinicella soli TaxID=333708 RepID=A0A7W7AXZ0_9SPHN|nr:DUF1467 family protein [Sphingosinicella soli]MBB4630451.1 putative secreted protein [Sphingosinicella soli]